MNAQQLEAELTKVRADLQASQAAVTDITAKLDAANKTVGEQAEQIKTITATANASAEAVVKLKEDNASLKASVEKLEKEQKSANAKALEIVACAGHVPPAKPAESIAAETKGSVMEQYSKLAATDPLAAAKFYAENKEKFSEAFASARKAN